MHNTLAIEISSMEFSSAVSLYILECCTSPQRLYPTKIAPSWIPDSGNEVSFGNFGRSVTVLQGWACLPRGCYRVVKLLGSILEK